MTWTKASFPNPNGPGTLADVLVDWTYFAVDKKARSLSLDVEVYLAEGFPAIKRYEYRITETTTPTYTQLTGGGSSAAAVALDASAAEFLQTRPELAGLVLLVPTPPPAPAAG